MAVASGNCFICGKTAGKTAIKNHILKEHNSGGRSGDSETCYLLKAEGAYDKGYWLFFTVSLDASLAAVDKFLRAIWCECCSHLSAFHESGREVGMARKISQLQVGNALLYEYDFGSTTEIVVTVVARIERPKQKEKVQLLARNAPAQEECDGCGAPAIYVNAWEGELVCEACAENVEDEAALLSIVNSPRCGECGYDGAQRAIIPLGRVYMACAKYADCIAKLDSWRFPLPPAADRLLTAQTALLPNPGKISKAPVFIPCFPEQPMHYNAAAKIAV